MMAILLFALRLSSSFPRKREPMRPCGMLLRPLTASDLTSFRDLLSEIGLGMDPRFRGDDGRRSEHDGRERGDDSRKEHAGAGQRNSLDGKHMRMRAPFRMRGLMPGPVPGIHAEAPAAPPVHAAPGLPGQGPAMSRRGRRMPATFPGGSRRAVP